MAPGQGWSSTWTYCEGGSQPGPFYRKARELYWDFAHSRS